LSELNIIHKAKKKIPWSCVVVIICYIKYKNKYIPITTYNPIIHRKSEQKKSSVGDDVNRPLNKGTFGSQRILIFSCNEILYVFSLAKPEIFETYKGCIIGACKSGLWEKCR